MSAPKCPHCCGTKQVVPCGSLYHCRKCNAFFDDDPDEGGTHSDRNPAARLEREERRKENARKR